VRLTARGNELQRVASEMSQALEAAWATTVGRKRFEALRATLEVMVERGLPPDSRRTVPS
jgi:hypothetical protein